MYNDDKLQEQVCNTINYEGEYKRLKHMNEALESQCKCYEEKEKSLLGQIEDLKQTIKTLSKLI